MGGGLGTEKVEAPGGRRVRGHRIYGPLRGDKDHEQKHDCQINRHPLRQSQAHFKVYYLPGTLNGIADVISHAVNKFDRDTALDDPNGSGLDELAVPIYHTVLIEMSDDFKTRLVDGYTSDKA